MIKYAANAFLATKITFINEIADLCEQTGADVQEVRRAWASTSASARKFLDAGPGYGGSCFPKDSAGADPHRRDFGSADALLETVV